MFKQSDIHEAPEWHSLLKLSALLRKFCFQTAWWQSTGPLTAGVGHGPRISMDLGASRSSFSQQQLDVPQVGSFRKGSSPFSSGRGSFLNQAGGIGSSPGTITSSWWQLVKQQP